MTIRPPSLYPPGTSPFRTRGSTYTGYREYVDARIRGGFPAILEHLPDDAHRAFAKQVFLPVAWYDALPITAHAEAAAAAEGARFADSVRARSTMVAQRDINGLYKLVLRVVSPELAFERLQRIATRYFDFGRVEMIDNHKGGSELQYVGIPEPLARWFMATLEGYSTAVLELAGARSPRFRFEPPKHDGEVGGVETMTLRFAVSWT